MMSDIYIEFNGLHVSSSERWDNVPQDKAIAAVKALRTILGKPDDINGRKLNK